MIILKIFSIALMLGIITYAAYDVYKKNEEIGYFLFNTMLVLPVLVYLIFN